MALQFDVSVGPVTPLQLACLVEAVVDALPEDETTWLEWKSWLDLDAKEGHIHIARAIIGFGNRMPDDAFRTVEGRAYLLVGAAAANLHGITPVDPVKLCRGVQAYTGEDGPAWTPTYITAGGKQVLVVAVEPPRWGAKVYRCEKEGPKVRSGDVFVRGQGETCHATAAQLDKLVQRASHSGQELLLSLEPVKGLQIERAEMSASAADAWLSAQQNRLLASLATYSKPSSFTSTRIAGAGEPRGFDEVMRATAASILNTVPESRTAQGFRNEVEEYLTECRSRMSAAIAGGVSRCVPPVRLGVRNLAVRNLPAVEVTLHLPAGVLAVLPPDPLFGSAELPDPPRSYGPRVRQDFLGDGLLGLGFDARTLIPAGPRPRLPEIHHVSDGGTTVVFPGVDLRPNGAAKLAAIVLTTESDSPIKAAWSATSTGCDGVLEGQLELPVSDRLVTFGELVSAPVR